MREVKSEIVKGWSWLQHQRLTAEELEDIAFGALEAGYRKPQPTEEFAALSSIAEHVPAARAMLDQWGQMQGLSTGFSEIDRLTLGMCPGELIVLGGYTSRGKTQLAVNIAWRVAQAGTPVLFVTLEMTKAQLTSRFMRLGEVGPATPILFQAVEVLEVAHIGDLIGRAKAEGVGLVVVDHLHYFARGKNLLEQVGAASREFKRFAVRHELPVLLLSQLSRPIDRRGGRLPLPQLSALKESGYVEQDADIVLMVHRDLPEDDSDDLEIDENQVVVVQRKNRPRGMRRGHNVAQLRHDAANGVSLFEQSPMFPASRAKI